MLLSLVYYLPLLSYLQRVHRFLQFLYERQRLSFHTLYKWLRHQVSLTDASTVWGFVWLLVLVYVLVGWCECGTEKGRVLQVWGKLSHHDKDDWGKNPVLSAWGTLPVYKKNHHNLQNVTSLLIQSYRTYTRNHHNWPAHSQQVYPRLFFSDLIVCSKHSAVIIPFTHLFP